jgi:large subunit ribosomal protein L23
MSGKSNWFTSGQVDLKEYLEKVYGFSVARINTLNYEGRKKRAKVPNTPGALLFYRRAGYKKAYVTLKPPETS